MFFITKASGWPPECNTAQEKDAYIQHIREADGVTLDRAKVVKNSGRRKIAKQVGLFIRYWGWCMYYIYIYIVQL